jgi:hypothetical protein
MPILAKEEPCGSLATRRRAQQVFNVQPFKQLKLVKNLFRGAAYCGVVISSFFVSCQRDGVEAVDNVVPNSPTEVGYLSNEKVRIPKGADPKAIQVVTKDEASKYVLGAFTSSGGRLSALTEKDPEALGRILVEKSKAYPTLDFSLDLLPEKDFNRIKQDFPDIRTQEEAYNKRETIALYYENRLRYDFIEAVKSLGSSIPSGGKLKAPSESSNSLPGGWGWLAATYSQSCSNALQSRDQINAETSARFPGGNMDGFRSNSFRHSGWCGLVARKNIAAGMSKENGVGEASLVCSAFECVSVNYDPSQPNSIFFVQTRNAAAAMDLFNNSVGRSFIYHNTTFGLFGVRKSFPSEEYFLNTMRDRNCIENAFYPTTTSVDQVLSYVQPGQEAAWTTLYRHTASDWHAFVRMYDGQNCN